MQRNEIESKLREKFGAKISFDEKSRLFPVAKVDEGNLLAVLRHCAEEESLGFDMLENMTAVDYDAAGVSVVYQLRSLKHKHELNIECSSQKLPSASAIWRSALAMESEIQELFGLQFNGAIEELRALFLPEGWQGNPLLRKYEYPREFAGIAHQRVDLKRGNP